MGCGSSIASEGGASGCGRGAAAALIGKAVTNNTSGDNWNDFSRGVATTISGGVTSRIMGGTFQSGAQTAAYGYLFNQVLTGLRGTVGGRLPLGGGSGGGSNSSDFDDLLGAGAAASSGSQSGSSSEKAKIFVTYTITNGEGGEYFGRTSGYGTPVEIVEDRARYHHMRLFGYGNPVVDQSASGDDGYAAIRGREQLLIDSRGGTGNPNVGNSINGISIFGTFKYEVQRSSNQGG